MGQNHRLVGAGGRVPDHARQRQLVIYLFIFLPSAVELRPSRTSGPPPPQSSFNPTSPAINHQAVCVIAINILFPAEVFVRDLSSRLFLIRFCWAAPALWAPPPPNNY